MLTKLQARTVKKICLENNLPWSTIDEKDIQEAKALLHEIYDDELLDIIGEHTASWAISDETIASMTMPLMEFILWQLQRLNTYDDGSVIMRSVNPWLKKIRTQLPFKLADIFMNGITDDDRQFFSTLIGTFFEINWYSARPDRSY